MNRLRKTSFSAKIADRCAQATQLFRQRPLIGTVVYFFGTQLIVSGVVRLYPRDALWVWPARAWTRAPLIIGWTVLCRTLSPLPHQQWRVIPNAYDLRSALGGVELGAIAYGVWLGVAYAKGWIRWTPWMRTTVSVRRLTSSILVMLVSDVVVAWHEEVAYRGYGFDSATATVGTPAAIVSTTTAFALGHGPGTMMFVGQGVVGGALLALRLASDSLWLPIGYHFAWNVLQTSIFGPLDALPSLLPLQTQGPRSWLGRPGYPEPGLLSTLVHLAVTAGITLWTWYRRQS